MPTMRLFSYPFQLKHSSKTWPARFAEISELIGESERNEMAKKSSIPVITLFAFL